jgi:AraC-like DNA-binding protein
LRIEHAKQLLKEGKNKTLSIEGIGSQSGFSSRSNFFSTFKSEVGMTPTEYLEENNKVQNLKQD